MNPLRVHPGMRLAALALMGLAIVGCSTRGPAANQPPVVIRAGDASVGCGMTIVDSPGPRAEAYVAGYHSALKFGSTRDFFAWILQPENRSRLQQLYVQDTARINWQHPSNAASSFIDARSAYYVAWQPLIGMMGPTYASFQSRSAAERFVSQYGGEVLRFGDITAELTAALTNHCPALGTAKADHARTCRNVSGSTVSAASSTTYEHSESTSHSHSPSTAPEAS